MSYNYAQEKYHIMLPENQETFLAMRDTFYELMKEHNVVMMQDVWIRSPKNFVTSWSDTAAVDRIVELDNNIKEIEYDACGQHRVFVKIFRDMIR